MCFPKPPKIATPAPLAAPAATGADNILLGQGLLGPLDEAQLRARGVQGRAALRIGRGRGGSVGPSTGRGSQGGDGGFSTLSSSPGSIFIGSGAGAGGSAGGGTTTSGIGPSGSRPTNVSRL